MTDVADIVIVGGGPVGATLALALAGGGIEAVVLESREEEAAGGDPRPLALSHGSRLILERLQVWQALGLVSPIEQIHVSQQGGFGRVAMTAAESELPALGYVTEYARLHAVLRKALGERVARCETGVKVTAVEPGRDVAAVEFMKGGIQQSLAARMVVIADGGALQGVGAIKVVDYHQAAVVAMVTSEMPHRQVAFERFTPDGPLALLPCGADLALVWTMNAGAARQCCEGPAETFLLRLQQQFGGRLGVFITVGTRSFFPLSLRFEREPALPRTVRIGNAAQTLHPVAGQGFNLGLRDAWELADEVANADRAALGSTAMLAAYRRRRRSDRRGGIWFTDSLVRVFSNDIAPLRIARGIALALLGAVPPAKDFVVRRMTFGARG
jgi:2-octaprenyl-6-methoxyphenol hydroxylase